VKDDPQQKENRQKALNAAYKNIKLFIDKVDSIRVEDTMDIGKFDALDLKDLTKNIHDDLNSVLK